MIDTGTLNADLGTSMQQSFPCAPLMPPPEPDSFSVAQNLSTSQSLCQHSSQEWESRRPEITRLYVDEKLPLQAVINTMKAEHGFFGTTKQYKDRIEKWSINIKNIKASEMKAVVRKRQQRKLDEQKETGFRIRGRKVELEKIEKFMKRNGISESSQYWPTSPAVSTPSVISCYTPSVRGPPTPDEGHSPAATTLEGVLRSTTLISNLEGHRQLSQFSFVDLSSIDESAEESLSSRDELHDHEQSEQGDYEMKDYQTEDYEDGDSGFYGNDQGPLTSHQSSSRNGEYTEEITNWGIDRGFHDLDIGKNDDSNTITGGYLTIKRKHLDFNWDDFPIEFGFGEVKDTKFEKNDYYAQPVTITIPRSLEPLPPSLFKNPMNLLYFHHFISHTAQLLVPHNCSSNPFQKILPKMAIQDENLMNLLLAYSASHRAQLLQQPQPAARIALWVHDVFPKLRFALNDLKSIKSNTSLATAIILASLEIISPTAFGISIPWQNHLFIARSIVLARGGVKSMYYERSDVSPFLLRWFAYLDLLGSLIDRFADLPSPTRSKNSWLYKYDFDTETDYQIDCMFGFTSRCIAILALVAELGRECDMNRSEWVTFEVIARAENLIADLEAARTNAQIRACPHLLSAGEAAHQWDTREIIATNEAYHWAGLIYLHQRILRKSTEHADVKNAVSEIIRAQFRVRKGSSADFRLLFPMFIAGCNTQDKKQRDFIIDRLRGIEGFGMIQVQRARTLLQKVWDTGKPWETLVSGEFIG